MSCCEDRPIESKEFRAPFVRVRGRFSREWQVQWSPCLRTEKGPREVQAKNPGLQARLETRPKAVVKPEGQYSVDFLDYKGNVLHTGPTEPRFFAKDQQWATFGARLPYHQQTQIVRLRRGERELGVMRVPTDRPCFTLLHPGEDACIDGSGVLHLRWCAHDTDHPLTFFVRYSHNGRTWCRPGVNLRASNYYLDLREMPGGERCVVQVLATNGYRTSYVETRHFEVPAKLPEIFLGETGGPVLFAQGFSREHGPIAGQDVAWLIEDGTVVQHGGTLDVRSLAAGIHRVNVKVSDPGGKDRTLLVGTYDSATGLPVRAQAL